MKRGLTQKWTAEGDRGSCVDIFRLSGTGKLFWRRVTMRCSGCDGHVTVVYRWLTDDLGRYVDTFFSKPHMWSFESSRKT